MITGIHMFMHVINITHFLFQESPLLDMLELISFDNIKKLRIKKITPRITFMLKMFLINV